MSISGQGEIGKIFMFEDFLGGADIAVTDTDAIKTAAGVCGPFAVYGSLAENDCVLSWSVRQVGMPELRVLTRTDLGWRLALRYR